MPKQKPSRLLRKGGSQDLPGVALEKAVARVQQLLDPNSRVTHNEKLADRAGNMRQYDVIIRGRFAGRACLGVIECKDHGRKAGPGDVDGFAKKTENLGANIRMMVAREGFTARALKVAIHEHIACLSLLSPEASIPSGAVGEWWYGEYAIWTQWRLHLHPANPPLPGEFSPVDGESVKWQGKPAYRWFLREFFTKHAGETREGIHGIALTFSEPREFEVNGRSCLLKGLSCEAIRVYKKKRRWVSWLGDAFFDWNEGKYVIPEGGRLVTSWVETDMSKWDDYSGEIPSPTPSDPQPSLRGMVTRYAQTWDQSEDVAELEGL